MAFILSCYALLSSSPPFSNPHPTELFCSKSQT
jgi:hypothetical protein